MGAYLEVWEPRGARLVPLDGERLTVGRGALNDIVVEADTAASRLHAVFERFQSGWAVHDMGSRNGTLVNGRTVVAARGLVDGDELLVGGTRLVFRSDEQRGGDRTVALAGDEAPVLTRREHEVLVALCRPLLAGTGAFTEPASVREVAATLVVTDAAVKQHLANLYDKFGLRTAEERRRVRLANEAVQRGAVTVAHLRKASP